MHPNTSIERRERSMATMGWSLLRLQSATLHPPALPPDDDDAEIPWVLLDKLAYVADCENATTAFSTTFDNKRIQVTFCLARPPRVSYICVFCPGLDHTEFPLEPKILGMEEDLVLLSIIVSSKQNAVHHMDYYIYQAADSAAGGGPSLKRLPRPPAPYGFESTHVGILRCGTNHKQHDDQSRFFLRPHRDTTYDDFYVVAGLCEAPSMKPGQFVLCRYSSKVPTHWSTDNISLNHQQLVQHGDCGFLHINSKVIAIGGNAGTMGFVDLWRGILFCDVLKGEGKSIPQLHYVPLPPRLLPHSISRGDARLSRDIAVVKDEEGRSMIKYVEMQVQWKPGQGFSGSSAKHGWVARTWKMLVSAICLEDGWIEDCTHESSVILVDNNPHFKQLPEALDHEGKQMPSFSGIDVRQPTLRIHDGDGIIYFMVKKNRMDPKAWVIAVDMKKNALLEVAEFAAERTVDITFVYMHCGISKYLRQAQGTKGKLKRPGMVLSGSSSKRRQAASMLLDDLVFLPCDTEMEEGDADHMSLDWPHYG
ncbi:hypothetical protein QOZ80_5AG0371870 [Eleusine coracana subsp. coracana]|nr:hypothetical protein QOZ80_5AG0371870 [Eleusine coracana subsp. coracana]